MNRPKLLGLISLIFGWSLLLAGCSSDTPTTTVPADDLNLTSEYGGYTAEDEAPAFGDAELASLMREDPVFNDDMFRSTELDSFRHLADVKFYGMAIQWGMLEGDSSVTAVTDWTGNIEVKYGGIHVQRTILFEMGQDYIVRPRVDRRTVNWVSLTTVHYDGVLLAIIVPPAPDGEDWSDNQVVFTTGPYSRTFTLSELESLSEIVDVGPDGNQVSFNARLIDLEACGSGVLDGRWFVNPSGRNGHFLGRWMSDDGLLAGHLRGHFGVRNDERVFFGKAIGLNGRFLGFLRGTWGADPADSSMGWFEGVLANRDGLPVGEVNGTWSSVPPSEEDIEIEGPGNGRGNRRNPGDHPVFGTNGKWTRGFFSGFWVKACPADDETAGL